MSRKIFVLVSVFALVLSGCIYVSTGGLNTGTEGEVSWGNSKGIKGNGNVQTFSYALSDYNALEVSGSFLVELVPNSQGDIMLECDENLVEIIDISTYGKTLKIKVKNGSYINQATTLKVRVPITQLSKIDLAGSGTIRSSQPITTTSLDIDRSGSGSIQLAVDVSYLVISSSGSGYVHLTGNSRKIAIDRSGSGKLDVKDIQAEDVLVESSGSGVVMVHATQKVKIHSSGSGNVFLYGNQSNSDISTSGSGNVIRKK